MISYQPEPIDTRGVELPDSVLQLAEQLARSTHEVWAHQRLAEGWRYGPERHDERKEHPGLIPYDQLSEAEKAYDRNTAIETLKAIIALGGRVEGPEGGVIDQDTSPAAPSSAAGAFALELGTLLRLWRKRGTIQASQITPAFYGQMGEQILKLGAPLVAYDCLSEGLKRWPDDGRLRQLLALALARSGATKRANSIAQALVQEGHTDEETLGILARTYKDLSFQAGEAQNRRRFLELAHEAYGRAYSLTGGSWSGVNAATTALLLGNAESAAALAREVQQACRLELDSRRSDQDDPYWTLATLGETAALLREWDEAEEYYCRAAVVARGRFGDLSTTRRNARLIVERLNGDWERIHRCLRIPRVVVFHAAAEETLPAPPLPLQLCDTVYESIARRLHELDADLGYVYVAGDVELLFLEALLARRGEAHIVLPYNRDRFVRDLTSRLLGAEWLHRCEEVLRQASEVIVASHQSPAPAASFGYAQLLVHGLASMRATQLETELVPLVLDRMRATHLPLDLSRTGKTEGEPVAWEDLTGVFDVSSLRRASPALETGGPVHRREGSAPEPEMAAILFADTAGFSRLDESQIAGFVESYLGAISRLAARFEPLVSNTWGDGLYFAFSRVRDAGLFALALCDLVSGTDWTERGLPPGLSIRVALHAGPVYRCQDPITGRPNYLGSHVSRAARLEPITPPGQVYASQAFAAIAAAEAVREFACAYVGHVPLAKGYGTFPTYHVSRTAEAPSADEVWPVPA